MSVTTADHNLVNNMLQPPANGDDVVDVDVRHELCDTSTSSEENPEVKTLLSSAKEIPSDDIVAKATDAAAEVLLLHLEANGDLETISTTEPSKESHEEAQLIAIVDGGSDEHATLPALDAKADSPQDTLIEPSIEVIRVGAKESLEDPSVTKAELASAESEIAASSSLKDIDATESDELGHAVSLAPSLEDAADANKDAENTPFVSSTINGIDTHPEQTQITPKIEDSADVSASALLSEDTPAAETPTLVTEAAVEHSLSELEETGTVQEPEPSKAASHEEATPVSDAVPTSMSESHDIPSQVALTEETLLDAKLVEDPTLILSDASLPKPTTTIQVVSTPAKDTSIPDDEEPVAAPSERAPVTKVEEEVAEQEIAKALDEADEVERASLATVAEEPAVAGAAVSTEEVPAVKTQDALAQVDVTVIDEEQNETIPEEDKAVIKEGLAVEEDAVAVEKASAITDASGVGVGAVIVNDDALTADKASTVEDTPLVVEAVVVEAAPTVEESPVAATVSVVEEGKSVEADVPVINAEIPIVDNEVPAVHEEDTVTSAEIPVMEEAPPVEEEVPVVNTEAPATDAEVPVMNGVPHVEEENSTIVKEVPGIEEDIPATNAEAPIVEETTSIETEAHVVERAPHVEGEVPVTHADDPDVKEATVVEDTPAAEAEVADIKAEASVTESDQAALEVAVPTSAQDVESDETTKVPVAEAMSAEQTESVVDEKPMETSLLANVEEITVEDLPAKAEETLLLTEQEALMEKHIEEPVAEEATSALTAITVDEVLPAKEDVTHQEDVAEVTEKQPDAAISEAEAEVTADTPEELAEGMATKAEEDVVSPTHEESKPTVDKVVDEQATLASELFEAPVESTEILQEETSVSTQEPVTRVEEPEPSAALPIVDEFITTSNEPQGDVNPTEGHEPVIEKLTRDPVESPEEEILSVSPPNADGDVGTQVKDTSPPASIEDVETPNLAAAEEAASTAPPVVEEEPLVEAAPVETDSLLAGSSIDDEPKQLEDSLMRAEPEEPQVETEPSQAQLDVETQEVNPTVNGLPTVTMQPDVDLIDEAAIEEETTEDKSEINDAPAVPLPTDETVEEIPEVVRESAEPTPEVHTVAEPPVSASPEDAAVPEKDLAHEIQEERVDAGNTDEAPYPNTLDTIENLPKDDLDAQISLEGASADYPQILDTTLPAPPEEVFAIVHPLESTEASLPTLPHDEQQHIVDDALMFSLETSSTQPFIETAAVTVSEGGSAVDEAPIPTETVDAPVEKPISDTGVDADEHYEAEHGTIHQNEAKTDDIAETAVEEEVSTSTPEEHTTSQEAKHVEKSIEAEPAKTVQQNNVAEVPVAEESAPVPEQHLAHVIENDIHLAHVGAESVLPTEEAETSEDIISTTNTFISENGSVVNGISELSGTVRVPELGSGAVEDEGQLHTKEMKPAEQLTSPDDDLLTPVSGAETERPKSPWTPSFQVTTVGRGISPDEDGEAPTSEHESLENASVVEAPVNEIAIAEITLGVPQVVTPVEEEKDDAPESSMLASDVEMPQSNTDKATLDTPPAEIARPWTPSYSVHSQGSPLHSATDLEQEVDGPIEDSHEQAEDGPDLSDMEFATNEEAPKAAVPAASMEKIEEVIEVVEHDPVATEEEAAPSDVPAPVADETPLDEAPITPMVAPAVIEGMIVHVRSLQVDANPSPTEEDIQDLEPALDATEDDAVATHGEDMQIEEPPTSEEVGQVPQLVLNISEEITQLHNLPEKETSPLHLTPQQYEQAQERPASPSWVASYSVNTQGSPLQEHVPLAEELASTSEEVTPKDELSSAPAVAVTHPEVTVQHHTSRESAEEPAASESLVNGLEDEKSVEEAAHVKPPGFTVLVNDSVTNVQEDTLPATSLSPVDDAIHLQDRPKSPWTPSYSVTMQGPGTPGEEQELENIEPLPQRTLDIDIAKNGDHDNLKTETIAPEVMEKTSPPNPPVVTIAEESKLPPIMALERELQDLQAAIHLDGDITPVANMAFVDATQQEYFPSIETTDQTAKLSKPSVSRLAPVDEVEGTDPGPTTSETVSSPSTRSRLESTTSSRFFPGGWFSTASKVVDEGRTSLEIAQGEFIPSKIISPVSPGDVSDTPDDASTTSAATGHASDSDDEDEEPEPKRRWCVVM